MPSKKKKYNARFPPARIKKIMQTDEEVGKVAAAVPVIISRALELFVEQLLRKSVEITVSRNAKTLSPAHLKQCVLAENRFDFLKDLVLSIPDVQGEGDDSVSVPGTPVTGSHQPPVFRSHSLSDATTSGRGRSVGGTGRPRGRPRKNHSVPQPVSAAKSASDDEDSDLDEDDDDDDEDDDTTESEPQRKMTKSSSNGNIVANPVPSSFQFNAAQPNFYQEINSSVQFQINIPPKNGAAFDQGKANDDEDYDT